MTYPHFSVLTCDLETPSSNTNPSANSNQGGRTTSIENCVSQIDDLFAHPPVCNSGCARADQPKDPPVAEARAGDQEFKVRVFCRQRVEFLYQK